ncbi:MAG: hypothetical protein K2H85_10795, partial [Allobaculum sp.]|nr:hypothetical protein [Allobaculum sp.]
ASMLDNVDTNHYFRAAEGYFGFNCQAEPTNDKLVRQALSYATPRAEFVDAYYQWPTKDGVAQVNSDIEDVTVGYVPTTFWNPISSSLGAVVVGEEQLPGLQKYEYDLDKAAALLDEAGWTMGSNNIREKDGKQLQIKFLATEGNSILNMLIPMIKASWNKIGIDLVQNTVDFNTMTTTIDPSNEDASSDWNVFFMALSFTGLGNTTMNLALGYTGTLEHPVPGSNNYPQLYNEELNNDLNAGKATGEESVSVENYKKAMILASEEASFLPIYGNNLFNLYNKRVKNLNTGSVCNWSQALEGAYLESDSAETE